MESAKQDRATRDDVGSLRNTESSDERFSWSDYEIQKKTEWDFRKTDDSNLCGQQDSTQASKRSIRPADHYWTARAFIESEPWDESHSGLVFYRGDWLRWTGTHYERLSLDDVRASVYEWLSRQFEIKNKKRVRVTVSSGLVSGIVDALKGVANVPSSVESPSWLDGSNADVIAFKNGLIEVDSIFESKVRMVEHTPSYFSMNCLPHDFDSAANCPNWDLFLRQVFNGDEERIQSLQMWFGYNLISDNRHHKIAMLHGPPRSGKGTTLAVMTALLGKHNVASASLSSLGGTFGLEPLIEKTSVIIDEGHIGRRTNSSLVLERLKAISGGSEQTVNRKGKSALPSVVMNTRFTMALNELPMMSDSSAALRSRLIVIPYFNSYEGCEDVGLKDRLLEEVSGITNWAIDGLRRLMADKRFPQPKAGQELLDQFVELSSPVGAFVKECCVSDSESFVEKKELQQAWRDWCRQNGERVSSRSDFCRQLRAVVPRISSRRLRINGERKLCFKGVDLNDDWFAKNAIA